MKAKQLRIACIALVLALASISVGAQTTGATPTQGTQTGPNQAKPAPSTPAPGTAPSQGGSAQGHVLRILSPKTGEQLKQNFVNVEFELTNSGVSAAATPNFEVQLDSRDPVTTSSNSYTFTGLKPGRHTVTVQLVDANGTPVMGARSQSQFVVVQPGPGAAPGAAILLEHRPPRMILAALRVEEADARAARRPLSSAAGALPLLSVIGFGVLLGGLASAMKTRPK